MGFWLRPPDDAADRPISTRSGHHAVPAPFNAPRTITASAERITLANAVQNTRPYLEWQRAAWVAYERVGEIHFGFNLLAGLLSRVRFFGAVKGEANEPPADIESAKTKVGRDLRSAVKALMDELFRSDGPGMVRNYVINWCVPGDCYLIQLPASTQQAERWVIRSVSEVQVRGDGSAALISRRDGAQQGTLPQGTFIARLWRRHPQHSQEPDSSLLGVADSVEELLMLQRLVRSATRSRLNAGLLFVPDGVASAVNPKKTAEPPIDEPDDPIAALRATSVDDPSGKFLADLMESMTRPINDETSASSVVPMLVVGPGDEGQKIRHITFERQSDAWLAERIEKVLDRILQGIDMPKEIVTGLQSVKYSNAVVIDDGMFKANVEPLALNFVDALTTVYLHPMLRAAGFSAEDIAQVVVWYDPTEIVTRPNSADEATEGWDRGTLSGATWRREHGYSENDAASEEERAALLLRNLSVIPEPILVELLRKAFPNVLGDVEIPERQPPPTGQNVVQFPQNPAAQPAPDPQATAIKQVGVT
ncbi:MAG TPA: hypothetical protein VF062_02160 [Candidatus Limnocylindrales bacterium]